MTRYKPDLVAPSDPRGMSEYLERELHRISYALENPEVIQIGYPKEIPDNGTTTVTINWKQGPFHKATVNASCTFTFVDPETPCQVILVITSSAVGARTWTFPANVLWPSGTVPTFTTTTNAIDYIRFYFDGTNYYGQAVLNNS